MPLRNMFYNIGDVLDKSRFSKHKKLNDKQKVQAGMLAVNLAGAVAAATVISIMMAIPDRTELADDWASDHGLDYTQLCYTPNPETETELHVRNDVRWAITNAMEHMDATGPIGRGVSNDLIANDTIFCIGPTHESGHAIHQASFGRELYFVSEDLIEDIDAELAMNLFERRGLYPTINATVEAREEHYITSAAFIWKRSAEAIKATSHVDGIYSILVSSGTGGNPFTEEAWLELEERPSRSAAAIAFREAYEATNNSSYYATGNNEARRAAFTAAVYSQALQEETDTPFLQWYEGEVDEQPETRMRQVPSTCFNSDMKPYSCLKPEFYTVMVDPASYVHSEDIHPGTLVALSDIFTDESPFLSMEDALDIINNPEALTFHNGRARMVYNQAEINARHYAGGNYQGHAEIGRGINANDVDFDGYELIARYD